MVIRREDLVGKKFGTLTVLAFAGIRRAKTFWRCRCACGKETEARADDLKDGRVQSCGCVRRYVKRGGGFVLRREDLTGRRFGRLTITGEGLKRPGEKGIRWRWRCECGEEGISPARNLRSGKTQSCGCIQREIASAQGKEQGPKNATHGMTDTPEYERWHGMMLRCHCPTQPSYPAYGGRGIKVCERWRTFENFYADMGPRPSAGYSLDRFPDTNGDYCPENCRWATHKEQNRNRRSNRPLTHNGVTKCMVEWAEQYGLTTLQLWHRLLYGWPIGLALTTPIGLKPPNLNAVRLPVDPLVRLKAYAHAAVYQAVRNGKLVRPPHCQHPGCATVRVEAHHHRGYAKEHFLDVVWLCRQHHEEADAAQG